MHTLVFALVYDLVIHRELEFDEFIGPLETFLAHYRKEVENEGSNPKLKKVHSTDPTSTSTSLCSTALSCCPSRFVFVFVLTESVAGACGGGWG